MRLDAAGHLSDDDLAAVVDTDMRDELRVQRHLETCAACRRRRADLTNLRTLLRANQDYEEAPRRDTVPGALKRLRLRRHTVTNLNEFFDSVYALVRGFASLLAVGESGESRRPRKFSAEDDPRG